MCVCLAIALSARESLHKVKGKDRFDGKKSDIMSPKEKQATPKVAFVFLGPLTKVPPAKAGSRARQRGEPEFTRY